MRVFLPLLLLACSDPASDAPDAAPFPQGPAVSLLSSRQDLGETGTITLTATVVDGNGVSDIDIGTLTNYDTSVVYGTFLYAGTVDAQTATYTFNLSWAAVNAVEPIDSQTASARHFAATFSDLAGLSGADTSLIDFVCADAFDTACAGVCLDVDHDEANCGLCGTGCIATDTCVNGDCIPVVETTCRYLNTPTYSCEDLCNLDGFHCAEGCGPDADAGTVTFATAADCGAATPLVLATASCSTVFSTLSGVEQVKCCCNHDSPYP